MYLNFIDIAAIYEIKLVYNCSYSYPVCPFSFSKHNVHSTCFLNIKHWEKDFKLLEIIFVKRLYFLPILLINTQPKAFWFAFLVFSMLWELELFVLLTSTLKSEVFSTPLDDHLRGVSDMDNAVHGELLCNNFLKRPSGTRQS